MGNREGGNRNRRERVGGGGGPGRELEGRGGKRGRRGGPGRELEGRGETKQGGAFIRCHRGCIERLPYNTPDCYYTANILRGTVLGRRGDSEGIWEQVLVLLGFLPFLLCYAGLSGLGWAGLGWAGLGRAGPGSGRGGAAAGGGGAKKHACLWVSPMAGWGAVRREGREGGWWPGCQWQPSWVAVRPLGRCAAAVGNRPLVGGLVQVSERACQRGHQSPGRPPG